MARRLRHPSLDCAQAGRLGRLHHLPDRGLAGPQGRRCPGDQRNDRAGPALVRRLPAAAGGSPGCLGGGLDRADRIGRGDLPLARFVPPLARPQQQHLRGLGRPTGPRIAPGPAADGHRQGLSRSGNLRRPRTQRHRLAAIAVGTGGHHRGPRRGPRTEPAGLGLRDRCGRPGLAAAWIRTAARSRHPLPARLPIKRRIASAHAAGQPRTNTRPGGSASP